MDQQPDNTLEQSLKQLQKTRQEMEQEPTGRGQSVAVNNLDQASERAVQQIRFAGFWIRLVAYLIDTIVLGVVYWVLNFIFSFGLRSASGYGILLPFFLYVPQFVIGLIYFVAMEAKYGQTLGKMAVGVKVVNRQGQLLSWALLVGRYCAKIISALPLCIGFLMIGWTKYKQGLHDLIVKSYVIKVK